jgi:hypothetical protein
MTVECIQVMLETSHFRLIWLVKFCVVKTMISVNITQKYDKNILKFEHFYAYFHFLEIHSRYVFFQTHSTSILFSVVPEIYNI